MDGQVEIFEAQDELVFMYRDMGTKLESNIADSTQGDIIPEYEMTEEGVGR